MKEENDNVAIEFIENDNGTKNTDSELFVICNQNIAFSSLINYNEKILNIRLFNTKSSLQSTKIDFNFFVNKVIKLRNSKEAIGEVSVNDTSMKITLRPKEIITLALEI